MAPPKRESLGQALERLRRSVHLSREGLARASEVSSSQLKNIARGADPRTGKTPQTRQPTLEQIARGLSLDPTTDTVDTERYDRFLRELKLAAGYVADVVPIGKPAFSRDALREQASAILAEYPEFAVDIVETGKHWNENDLILLRAYMESVRQRIRGEAAAQ